MYAALTCEPWCFPPSVVAGLTDFQVEELYLKPQAEAARRAEAQARGESPGAADPGDTGFPDRATYVAFTRDTFGWPADKAGAEWDRMKAEWDAQRGKA